MSRDIKDNVLPQTASLRDASERLNSGVGGIILVVDDNGAMTGMLTDGDMRRALLAGGALEDTVDTRMNRNFQSVRDGISREDALRRLDNRIRHMPILDDHDRPLDMVSWTEIWSLPISEPSLGGNELKYISDCIQTMWISSQGAYIGKFETALQEFLGAPYSLSTSSGTTALQLAIAALNIGPGDEVLIPAITFGACANAVIHAGATPVFVDVDPYTKTLDSAAARDAITEHTKAMMPVHLYGHPCDMDPIMEIATEHGLKVIEDCAEALGAEYKGRRVGTFGDVSCFSFYANKVITTGEGGMVVTGDEALYQRMGLLRDHGMSPERRYWHLEAGFNYRMTNLQAAVGLAQMECIEDFLARRLEVARVYTEGLRGLNGVTLPPEADWAKSIYWLYCIEVDPAERDRLMARLRDKGIDTRPIFPPLHIQPAYGSCPPGAFPVSEAYAAGGISLPSSNALCNDDAERVVEEITRAVR